MILSIIKTYFVVPKIAVVLLVAILFGCTEQGPAINSTPLIESAHWDNANSSLHMKGHALGDGSTVSVFNARTNEKIGSTFITNKHHWKLELQNIQFAPCSIRAEVNNKSDEKKVTAVPNTCDQGGTIRSRALTNIAANTGPDVSLAGLPDGRITQPNYNVTITAGSSVFFAGVGTSDNVNAPLTYQWDFEGGARPTNVQNPGAVSFTKPGVYRISLTVANEQGRDITPATRLVTVKPVSASILAAPPLANIDSPIGPQTILVGDSVFFAGSGFDPLDTGPLNYLWNFEGAAPNSTEQNPGLIVFNQPGIFNVSLTVFDSQGNRNLEPATVAITVIDAGAANIPPKGEITSPGTDIVVSSGSGVFFQGTGTDDDGNLPLNYFWDFSGAAPNNMQEVPGIISFISPGIYPVTLLVSDSLGAIDPNPPVRLITVLDATLNNNDFPTGTILTPDSDISINIGDSVGFTAEGSSPTGNEPLSYLWTFGDPDIPDSMEQNPPPVTFNVPGVFSVTLTVTDSLGQADPMPPQIVVTVLDPATPVSGPQGEIISPSGDVTVEAGMAVDFQGDGDDAAGNHPITYLWNFGDPAIPDSMDQNPGPVIFETPGMYTVTLMVMDSLGNVDDTPAQVVITVVEPGASPADPAPPATPPAQLTEAPDGIIINPASDITIMVGDTIELIGTGMDPSGSPLSFSWDIDGGPGNSTAQSPGNTTFTMVGTWDVELTVTNDEGIADPSPAKITVTVLDETPPP